MQNDIFLVIGVLVLGFSVPAVISAFSESRPPRAAAIMFMIGGGLVALAISQTPGGYSFEDIPKAFVRVIGHYLN